ncbi:MAG: hypothetical protein ABSH22_10485 [Tepidisphaeraceae bacterium]
MPNKTFSILRSAQQALLGAKELFDLLFAWLPETIYLIGDEFRPRRVLRWAVTVAVLLLGVYFAR